MNKERGIKDMIIPFGETGIGVYGLIKTLNMAGIAPAVTVLALGTLFASLTVDGMRRTRNLFSTSK